MTKKKYIYPLVLGLFCSVALTSCRIGGKTDEDTTKTSISFCTFQGTGGTQWITNALERFAKLKANESYETGKVGISYKVTQKGEVANGNKILEEGYDIYCDENRSKIFENAQGEFVLDVSSVVNKIENKIDEDCLKRMKGPDGKYYALPHYEWFNGVTYDADYLDSKKLYFAAPDEQNSEEATTSSRKFYNYPSESFKFIAAKSAKKSVGPDGVYGTSDDGLPSSIQELCIFCEQVKSVGGKPFLNAGSASVYSFYLTHALWSSLAGVNKMKNVFCNYTDASVDVVTGYSATEELFYEGSGIPAPITQTIPSLNDTNGFNMYSMVERYYSLAFMELMLKESWYSEKDMAASNQSAFDAQDKFINRPDDGQAYAILLDASYWYHEAKDNGCMESLESPRNVTFMPLPTQFDGTASVKTAENATKQTLIDTGSTYIYASAACKDNEGKKRAVLEFLEFLYTDDELNNFSKLTGLTCPIDYGFDTSSMDPYYKNLESLKRSANILHVASDAPRFNKNTQFFSLWYNSPVINVIINNVDMHDVGYRDMMRLNKNIHANTIFEAGKILEASWNNMSH